MCLFLFVFVSVALSLFLGSWFALVLGGPLGCGVLGTGTLLGLFTDLYPPHPGYWATPPTPSCVGSSTGYVCLGFLQLGFSAGPWGV